MQQKQRILIGIGASALALAIGVGAVLAAGPRGQASPAPASGTTSTVAGTGSGAGAGYRGGSGSGAYGAGSATAGQARSQAFATALAQPSGTLTAEQQSSLAGMAEEEKLALDVYTTFASQYSTPVWRNIAASEAIHLATVRTLLARYGIADPTAGRSAGDFASLETTSLYRSLVAQGASSEAAAWGVGVTIESDDIARLDAATADVNAPDVTAVYANLRSASVQHLASFNRLLGR